MALHEWDPDKVQQAIDADLHLNMDEDGNTLSYEQLAKDRLRENVPFAVSVLAHIMQYSDNENLRAKVAQYMVDRVIGRVSDQPLFTSGSDDPLMRIMEEVTSRGAN